MNYHLVMPWMVVLSTILIVPSSLAATHNVGDSTGWATPTGGDPYATWASQHTFVVGDVLGMCNFILLKTKNLLR